MNIIAWFRPRVFDKSRQGGLAGSASLIELLIVFMVISIAAPLLWRMGLAVRKNMNNMRTEQRIKEITDAIVFHFMMNHTIPRPSSPDPCTPDFGFSRPDHRTGKKNPPIKSDEFVGIVPFRTLGLPESSTWAGDGVNRFTYVVNHNSTIIHSRGNLLEGSAILQKAEKIIDSLLNNDYSFFCLPYENLRVMQGDSPVCERGKDQDVVIFSLIIQPQTGFTRQGKRPDKLPKNKYKLQNVTLGAACNDPAKIEYTIYASPPPSSKEPFDDKVYFWTHRRLLPRLNIPQRDIKVMFLNTTFNNPNNSQEKLHVWLSRDSECRNEDKEKIEKCLNPIFMMAVLNEKNFLPSMISPSDEKKEENAHP